MPDSERTTGKRQRYWEIWSLGLIAGLVAALEGNMIWVGSLDAIVPPEHANFFERVPGVKIAMIEGAGHSPMVKAPAKT